MHPARLLQIIFGGLVLLVALPLLAGMAAKDPSLQLPFLMLLLVGIWTLGGRWRSLRPLLILLVGTLLFPIVVVQALSSTDPFGALVGLMLVSTGAYFWREHRLRRRQRRVRVRGAERTPVLPHREDEE